MVNTFHSLYLSFPKSGRDRGKGCMSSFKSPAIICTADKSAALF